MSDATEELPPVDIEELKRAGFGKLNAREFRAVGAQLLTLYQQDRQMNQLRYYEPVSPMAMKIHEASERVIGVGGGNGSSKTETCMVEMLVRATGIIPDSLSHIDWRSKFRGPVKQRIVVESLTTTLHTVILPKLMWWKWTGVGRPGSEQGHWGWIPKWSLIDGQWERSWSEKLRLLTFLCHDPESPDKVLGTSSIQFMSHDQNPEDFASGDFDDILHDEPPRLAIYTENEARTMRADGRLFLAMTWPDDPSIPVDWIHEKIYDIGQGPNKADDTVWFNLFTTDNPHLNQARIAAQAAKWDDETRKVRIYGQSVRFSNRIHPLFMDQDNWWCFDCGKLCFPSYDAGDVCCTKCSGGRVVTLNHVDVFETQPRWPTVFLLDPHPRKDHMGLWVQITPSNDWWARAEIQSSAGCEDFALEVTEFEQRQGFNVARRLMDPNMGASPSNARKREETWQDAFREADLFCDLADDSGVGRRGVNDMLRPDAHTLRPRLIVHRECKLCIYQMLRFSWDDHKRDLEKAQKQKPKETNDDYPALLRYLANSKPDFGSLTMGDPIITRRQANVDARKRQRRRR